MQTTIFLTGATGFLGRNLVPVLLEAGYRVRAFTRNPDQHPWLQDYAGVQPVKGNLEDYDSVEAGMAGCEYVIHAGGLFRMWGAEEDFFRTNVTGSDNVARAACAHGIRRLVHISTIAVIGNPTPGFIIDENHPPRPADPYQRSKLAAEQHMRTWHTSCGLPVVILRPGAYYGPHGRYAFNRLFFEDPLKGLRIKVDGGRHIIFPVYVKDVAVAAMTALSSGQRGEIYNVCGDPISHDTANRIISAEAGISPWRFNAPAGLMIGLASAWNWFSRYIRREPYYPINLRSYVFNDWHTSSERARRELGFTPTPFREGVRQTLAWYRTQDFRWARKIRLAV
ncbi:MAG: NAD-dependent epimerase/dehydratase family protein [Anaerolineae bacterium]